MYWKWTCFLLCDCTTCLFFIAPKTPHKAPQYIQLTWENSLVGVVATRPEQYWNSLSCQWSLTTAWIGCTPWKAATPKAQNHKGGPHYHEPLGFPINCNPLRSSKPRGLPQCFIVPWMVLHLLWQNPQTIQSHSALHILHTKGPQTLNWTSWEGSCFC